MIVNCPACNARFKVPEHLVPVGGRTLRCSRCKHDWHYDPAVVEAELIIPKPEPVPEPQHGDLAMPVAEVEQVSDTPPAQEVDDDFMKRLEEVIATGEAQPAAKKRPTPTRRASDPKPAIDVAWLKWAVPALVAGWLGVSFFAYMPSWSKAPVIGGLYRAVGATETEGLVFSDVTMERQAGEDGKGKFILAGSIRNYAHETRTVPTVRVQLNDAAGKALWGREYPVNHELKAGEVYPFRITNVETSFADKVSNIAVDMGNALQLMVR